jgi:hypothetical protein
MSSSQQNAQRGYVSGRGSTIITKHEYVILSRSNLWSAWDLCRLVQICADVCRIMQTFADMWRHESFYDQALLLFCDAVYFGSHIPRFDMNRMPPSSGWKSQLGGAKRCMQQGEKLTEPKQVTGPYASHPEHRGLRSGKLRKLYSIPGRGKRFVYIPQHLDRL